MLQNPNIRPDPRRAHADVQIREGHAEKRDPSPFHVAFIQHGAETPPLVASGYLTWIVGAGEAILLAADQVAHGVAAKGKAGQQIDIRAHDERTEADAELCTADGKSPGIQLRPPESLKSIPGQQQQEHEGNVHEVAMEVLQD